MNLKRETNIERVREVAQLLINENQRLTAEIVRAKRQLLILRGATPEELQQQLLTRLALPPASGNNPTCSCADGVASGCLSCVPFQFQPDVLDAECILGRLEITLAGVQNLELGALRYADDVFIASQDFETISPPPLERVGVLAFPGGDGLPRLTSISAPSLRTATRVLLQSQKPSLTSIDLSALRSVDEISVVCVDNVNRCAPQCEALAIPLATLRLDDVEAIGSLTLDGCTDLPRCALDADLVGATVGALQADDLNQQCDCDVDGDVLAGTCEQ